MTSRTAPDGTVLSRTRYEHHGGTNARTQVITTSTLGAEEIVETLNLAQDGLVRTQVDGTGVSACFHHGAFGTLTSVVRNCSGVNVTSSTTYDVLGHVLTQSDPAAGVRASKWNGCCRRPACAGIRRRDLGRSAVGAGLLVGHQPFARSARRLRRG